MSKSFFYGHHCQKNIGLELLGDILKSLIITELKFAPKLFGKNGVSSNEFLESI
jgi:hypothetical protein